MSKKTSFFLGANTPDGFVSFFDELYNPYNSCTAYIIKGGPGTGKSTLMKKIGQVALDKGYNAEYVYCSSDGKSLDGLIVPELNLSVADGTSPHTLEPKFPGAAESIINPGDFWNKEKLRSSADKIRTLTLENSLHHRRSSAYLASAGKIYNESMRICRSFIKEEKINSFAIRFAARECEKKQNACPGRRLKRFLSGITPDGVLFFDSTVQTLCTRVIGIDDEYGAVSTLLCERCGEIILSKGYDVIFCHCPLRPHECEHIIIPELSLCVMSIKKEHPTSIECDRIIHSRRFLDEGIAQHKQRLKFNRKLIKELIDQSVHCLCDAKKVHDELEKIYIGAMNFTAFEKYTAKLIEEIFSLR